ncbi:MAG: M14 family zinc carboxypeptidase [Anaerolineae bacterium]
MRIRFLLGAAIVLLIGLASFAPGAGILPPAAAAAAPDGPVVVRIEFDSPDQLRDLAGELDIWEVHHDEGYLVALLEPDQYLSLASAGYRLEIDEVLSDHPDTIPGYPCYRTIAELYTDLAQRAAQHPGLTLLKNIGTSYEGRPIKVLRITNEAIVKDKPVFFLMANIHGRELITPETAMVFIDYLLDNYDVDPDVTWLLDHHEIQVSVSTNPDGHVKNEPGEPWAWWRKNANPENGSCGGTDYGVDLNRNHSFKWGCCGGSSGDPCAETYRGPYVASEDETQDLQNYIRTLFPDQRGPDDTDPAPLDATGVLITLHSYSNLVLWPWGWTGTPSPNAAGLEALGEKMATYNGYNPGQSMTLYPTDGTTDDWAYGELGVASYTFEIGSSSDNFYPMCSRYDALIQPNIPALFYAATVARTPYMTSHGPDALSVDVDSDFVLGGLPVHLTATINDSGNGSNGIAAAEYYVDVPPWDGGTPGPMVAADGAFGQVVEDAEADVPTAGWLPGRHMIFVRGRDVMGNWGPVSAVFVETDVDSFIDGHVTDASAALPIDAANLLLEGSAATYDVATDAAGYYHVPVLNGSYDVTASAFGYYPETVTGVVATTGMTTTQDFGLSPQPTGTLAGSVIELGTDAPLVAHVVVEGTPVETDTDAAGAYSLILPQGIYALTASAPGHEDRTVDGVVIAAGQSNNLDLRLPTPPCVLLVDDDYSGSLPDTYEDEYIAALQTAGIDYDIWSVKEQGFPTAAELGAYPALVWFTGDVRYGTLNITEQTALRQYLVEDGGGLWLSGQNIAFDIASDPGDFLGTVLGASFVDDDAGVTGVAGHDLFAGLSLSLAGGDGAGNQDSPDVISALPGATTVLSYAADGTAGVSIDSGSYRSLFASFGIEGVATAAGRERLLADGLSWLGCSAAPVDLRIVKSGPSAVAAGGSVTYILTLDNNSAVPLSGLVVSDTLPVELDFVSASPAATFDGTYVHWSGLSLPTEGQLQLTLQARIKDSVAPGTIIRNTSYGAQAVQIAAPAMGTHVVETRVTILEPNSLFLPLILRPTTG